MKMVVNPWVERDIRFLFENEIEFRAIFVFHFHYQIKKRISNPNFDFQ